MTQRADRTLAQLGRLATDVGPALQPVGHAALLRSITETARRLFDAAACSLALLSEDEEELVFHVASGAGAADVTGLRIPAGRGVAGWVVMSGQPIVIEDVRTDPRFAADVAESTGYVPTSIIAMPMETERRMLGVIEVLDRGRQMQRADDLELLGVFATQAALAIEGAQVFGELGRAIFEAAAAAAQGEELGDILRRQAERAARTQADVAELARAFWELGQASEVQRRLAARLVAEVLSFLRQRGT